MAESIHERRKLLLALSCLVVFVTTYVLILPAFTLDKEEAAEQGGLDVPAIEQSLDVDEDSETVAADKIDSEGEMESAAKAEDSGAEEPSGEVSDNNAEPSDKEDENKKTQATEKDAEKKPSDVNEKDASKQNPEESGKETVKPDADETAKPSAKSEAPSNVTLTNKESDGFIVAVEGKDAGLSENMSVAVREIDQNDRKQKKEYDSLYNDALAAVQDAREKDGLEKPSDFVFAKFYDISLMNGKTEVEPDAAVDVRISFSKVLQKELKVTDPEMVQVVHFTADKETGEVTPEVLDAGSTDITVKNNKVTEAAFTADSFSVFAVVYSQLSTNVLTSDGRNYKITVTFDEDAGIPAGTELVAKEIEENSDEFNQHLGRLWNEINKEYFKVEEMREHYNEGMGILPDVNLTNINMVRFFDVSLVKDGKKIEPKAPVSVEITYDKGLLAPEGTTPGIVHFASDKEIDIISKVDTTASGNEVTGFRYEQGGFSDIGTFVGQETHDIINEPNLSSNLDPNGGSSSRSVNLSNDTIEDIILSAAKPYGPLRAGEADPGEEQSSDNDHTKLEHPVGSKTLTPNKNGDQKDGTYTLSLSVKGHSSVSSEEVVKKSNILFVMDRSSSMITNHIDDNDTYWLHDGTNYRDDLHYYGKIGDNYIGLNKMTNQWGQVYFQRTDNYQTYNGDIYVRSKTTRFAGEQEALGGLFSKLLDKNDASGENKDVIEISVISFADQKYKGKNTEVDWTDGRETQTLINGITSNQYASGTNWEEALKYAKDVLDAKKASDTEAGKSEDYYVVFLTDGEPTATSDHAGVGAYYYPGAPYPRNTFEPAYTAARDDAAALVNAGYKLYNIFTYGNDTDNIDYLRRLTNYAYTNGADDSATATTNWVRDYFVDARTTDKLVEAFDNIFLRIEDAIGHANVSITDTLTTDAMTTTVVHGKTNGYEYKVTRPNPEDPDNPTTLYTVTATGDLDNPTVTFNVPDSSTENYVAQASTVGGKTVYSVTTAEGRTYKMALADINDQTGKLTWDLSPVGMLMDNCTYSVNFIVWPDQDAYDYVAALNNGLPGYTWDVNAETYEDLRDSKGYEKGGVEQFPSIVRKKDGTFAVLTNTDQKIHYSVVETKTENGQTETRTEGPFYSDLPLPDPMPLESSDSSIEKVWNVERDPGILAQMLYEFDEETGSLTSKKFSITFDIMQGAGEDESKYTDVTLGWDEATGKYLWEEGSETTVRYKGQNCTVGTRWASDFSIATGLMLSEERMNALRLDKNAYPSGTYKGTEYWILETGHDYKIKEPGLTFEFDFESPVYHPMLVDGVLQSANFTISEDGKTATITNITNEEFGLPSLKVQNTLRGYINLDKIVVDTDGETPVPDDDSKFKYIVELRNDTDPGPFTEEGSHVPWYGISGLYYHDEEGNYYQADPNGTGKVTITDESGNTYAATCTGVFEEIVGPQTVRLPDGTDLELHGNQMTHDSDNYVYAEITINQNQTLNIANVPVGTEYTITEENKDGYQLVRIEREIKENEEATSADSSDTVDDSNVIEGTIVANRDNHITYYNKTLITDINVKKTDDKDTGLEGAVFQLVTVSDDGHTETPATEISSITGIGDVEKTVGGEAKTFASSFETTGEIQTLSGLPDGTYRLKEVYVPDGYISTYKYIQFTIENREMKDVTTDSGDTSKLDTTENGIDIKITNEAGAELPHTGGIGTTVIYIFGSILIVGSGLLLWRKRRTN